MAIIIHKNIIEGELHPPKGFNLPSTNPMSYALRSESDVAIYQDVEYLPGALNFVDGNNPPPTTAVDDIYVIFDGGGGVVDAAWGGISFDSWTRQDGSNWNEVAPVDGYQCYDKTAKEYKTFNGTVWTSGGVIPSGPFALFDSAGVPTYYTTLSLVAAASSAGDTIQQFANGVETVTEVLLPFGVNWNLNGFTYEKTAGSRAIQIAANSTNRVTNGRIFANGSGNCIDAPLANCHIYCDGLTLQSTGEVVRGSASSHFYNARYLSDSSTAFPVNNGFHYRCTLRATGTTRGADSCQDLVQCDFSSLSSSTVYRLLGKAYDCRIHSDGDHACESAGGGNSFKGVNCTITSSADNAIDVVNVEVEDCFIESLAGTGITSSTGFAKGCTIKGVSGDFAYRTVFGSQKVERCTIINSAGRGIDRGANSELINCVVRSTFNSANGDAIRVNTGLVAGSAPVIANCSVEVVNTSANYLYSSGATVANFANVVSIDKLVVTTPVHANITQGVVTISDNQGNNL